MANTIVIKTIDELRRFVNEKGIIEIVTRDKGKKLKAFFKVAIDKAQAGETEAKMDAVLSLLSKNTQLGEKSIQMLQGITKLSSLGLVLDGLNLCATLAGFAMMSKKLDGMSAQIDQVVQAVKEAEGIRTEFEFRKVLSWHSDMLDCRKKQKYYSEEKMRELVDAEYNTLGLLIRVFSSSVADDRESLLFSILSLASMLTVSIKFFDELYYFNNRDAIGNGDIWHLSHEEWVSVFDKLISVSFIEMVQDLGFFEKGLNTVENDWFYFSFLKQIKSLRQEIVDNQTLITTIDDPETLRVYSELTRQDIIAEIEGAIQAAGAPVEAFQDAIKAAVA